ncbi:hypothetical protein LI073_12340 [bacterium 210917-SL.2.15]|nr:hypothetical protein [bacterium 210917-SL.2.15]
MPELLSVFDNWFFLLNAITGVLFLIAGVYFTVKPEKSAFLISNFACRPKAERGRLLDRFLRTLPEKECSIFLRRYWFVDSVEEIARRYGLRSGAVKTRLHRTRRKLRDYLQKEGYVL